MPTLIAGRKLLLADDSIAIQKVVDLTFTDEGMEVETVGDGQDALDKLNQFQPDVVLADVYMPGVDGYELCKFIKQNERFSRIPVMLLIGSFEPFDQAKAEGAGADDVVTKPFQSIRQLVSRVGSLLSSENATEQDSANAHSTLGLKADDAGRSVEDNQESESRADVPVFVEAAVMPEPPAVSEHYCTPDIEIQTADTRELHPEDMEVPVETAQFVDEYETFEIEAIEENDSNEVETAELSAVREASAMALQDFTPLPRPTTPEFGSVLDLGDVDTGTKTDAGEDFVWDLDFESEEMIAAPMDGDASATFEGGDATAAIADSSEPSTIISEPQLTGQTVSQTAREVEGESISTTQSSFGTLSPEAIEAISRRVVEQLSDKVIREIAWEVVPELSELLIKQRMDQK